MGNGTAETLRERKRRETRAAIEHAAMALVDELGYDNVTVAMIAERAVVSQGTFFNYFPTKDAAVVGLGPLDLDPAVVHAAYDRLAPATPYRATLELFLKVVRDLDWTSDTAAMRARLVTQTPALMRLFLDRTFGFVADFRGILAAYLEAHPERRTCADALTADEEAGLVVSEALEAAKFALARAAARPGHGLPDADEVEAVVRRIVG
ncbi:TetR/AcrR family transcriptional regulator [Arabiibacter massiliensis]|uniref:TetR/AcrR family transcriptional regulator n=1 Tax=Arabiibacter massiliensis TaxID=1870985 RepID=UPI001E5E747E|nr:TetR family transcriptional regulator [Arabiibacter massiliensis]